MSLFICLFTVLNVVCLAYWHYTCSAQIINQFELALMIYSFEPPCSNQRYRVIMMFVIICITWSNFKPWYCLWKINDRLNCYDFFFFGRICTFFDHLWSIHDLLMIDFVASDKTIILCTNSIIWPINIFIWLEKLVGVFDHCKCNTILIFSIIIISSFGPIIISVG